MDGYIRFYQVRFAMVNKQGVVVYSDIVLMGLESDSPTEAWARVQARYGEELARRYDAVLTIRDVKLV